MVKFKSELVIDSKATFGELEFMGLGREHYDYDEATGEIKELERRSYDILSSAQGTLLEINLDAAIPELEIPVSSIVELVNPSVRMFNASGQAKSYITADQIKPAIKPIPINPQAISTAKQDESVTKTMPTKPNAADDVKLNHGTNKITKP